MSTSTKKSMPFKIDFLCDFEGFGEGKWSQVGTKMEPKTFITSKGEFLKNRALAAAGARYLRFWGSKLGTNIDQNRSKDEVNMGRPPGLHFFWILMDLGTQLGAKSGRKIEARQD